MHEMEGAGVKRTAELQGQDTQASELPTLPVELQAYETSAELPTQREVRRSTRFAWLDLLP